MGTHFGKTDSLAEPVCAVSMVEVGGVAYPGGVRGGGVPGVRGTVVQGALVVGYPWYGSGLSQYTG